MAYQAQHVTSASGMVIWTGNDTIDGWPIGPLKLAQKTTFFTGTHGDSMHRLFLKAQSTLYASGAQTGYASGTITGFVTGGVGGAGALNLPPGSQTRWWRSGEGLPRREQQ